MYGRRSPVKPTRAEAGAARWPGLTAPGRGLIEERTRAGVQVEFV